jgi:stearoyl-CoA desaturase (delta-9 desaturase)
LGNWAFWYTVFYLIGGHPLACTLFTGAMFWITFVRIFNYTGHGKGEHKHVDGLDFDRSNLSINQWRPGYFRRRMAQQFIIYILQVQELAF